MTHDYVHNAVYFTDKNSNKLSFKQFTALHLKGHN